jgi:flavin-dependent dehydrogenase
MLRRMTADTPGVDFMPALTAVELLGGDRPSGVTVRGKDGAVRDVRARLVVAADGRDSGIARLAGVRGRVRPHGRFFYWGYFRNLGWDHHPRSRMWLLDPDAAYVFPNEDGITLVLLAPHKDRLHEFKSDLEGSFARMVASLPGGPRLEGAERVGKLLGKLDLPNVLRPAARPGLAFVGDAALACDPLWGIGCGWAMQTADWLVQETATALRGDDAELDAALDRYRKLHLRRLAPHHLTIADTASGRPVNGFDRFLWRAAARDRHVASAFAQVGTRTQSPASIFRPDTLARAILANVRKGI